MAKSKHDKKDNKYKDSCAALSAVQVKIESIVNESVVVYQQGQVDEALAFIENALIQYPEQIRLLDVAGIYAMAANNFSLSAAYFKKYLLLDQNNATVYYNYAGVLSQLSCDDEAEISYRQAIERKPDFVDALYNLANLLMDRQKYLAAIEYYQSVLNCQPKHTDAMVNLGLCFQYVWQFKQAENTFAQVIELLPADATAYNNLGNLLAKIKRFDEAETAFISALKFRQNYANACTNLSLLLLSQGRFEEGWQAHETRFYPNKDNRSVQPVAGGVKQWQGEPIIGQSLLIWPEQGFGDEIQFVRYLPLLKKAGIKRVVLVCKKPLKRLFSELECVDKVICIDDFNKTDMQGIDRWVFIMSLPFCFKTRLDSIPANLPYLRVAEKTVMHWADFIPASTFNVGLVWKGSAFHKNDGSRSLSSLAVLEPLWAVDNVTFISLQKGAAEDEALRPSTDQPIISLGDKVDDFADMAAIISQLDLVVCVDTAIAHLAGALNKPCWVLLPAFDTDWRWLQDRADSPWYPEVVRLFRQAKDGEWMEVVQQVKQALQEETQITFEGFLNRSVVLFQQGKSKEALGITEQALIKFPKHPVLLGNAGAFCSDMGDKQAAIDYLQKSLKIDSTNPDVFHNLAGLYNDRHQYIEAMECYQQALELKPSFTEVHFNLGCLLEKQKMFNEAEVCFNNVLKIKADHIDATLHLANIFYLQQRYDEAEKTNFHALKLQPDHADAYNNLGTVFVAVNRYNDAMVCYQKAVELRPDDAIMQFNYALVLLSLGYFKEGWVAYEARYHPSKVDRQAVPPEINIPQWQGESLVGKSLLVWPEQGLGDAIQFVRYLVLLKDKGVDRLLLVCKKPLQTIFSGLECVDEVICLDEFNANHVQGLDYWVFMMSLPLYFETIPANLPYLSCADSSKQRWADLLPKSTFRVGLVWKGNVTHKNDANRSLSSLAVLKPLWSVEGVSFVSLQKGAGEDDVLNCAAEQGIIHLGDKIDDFSDTAAIVMQLDLVICVDTAVAHLAGALNKPCWVLLPAYETDWRWQQDRDDSLWYPSVLRLFRQTSHEKGWGEVVQRVKQSLQEVVLARL